MVDKNQTKSIAKTIGFFCVAIGLFYLSLFIFSYKRPLPVAALVCVAVGIVLLTLSKRR